MEIYSSEEEDFIPTTYEEYLFSLDTDLEIQELIYNDDKDRFVSKIRALVENTGYFVVDDDDLSPDIMDDVIQFGAIKCTEALLRGETGLRVDLNVPFVYGVFPLHLAAARYSIALIQLCLKHGALTNVRTNGDDLINNGLLPLNVALEQLRYHDYLKDWTPKDSIFKLITILCLPQMKVPLEATRLLALHTKETTQEFFHYAKDGHPLEMAVLLMVARDIVLAPFRSQDGLTLNGIMSIRRCIKEEMATLAQEEAELADKGKGRNSTPVRMVKDKKAGLFTVLTLLDVFEKAGDAIDAYLQLDPANKLSKDKVVEDVKSILVKAGFELKKRDTDLTKIIWETYDGWNCDTQLASEKFERTTAEISQPLGQHLPLQSLQDGLMGKQSICHVNEPKSGFKRFFFGWTPTLSTKIVSSRPYCTFPMSKTWLASPKKRTKPIQQFLPNLPKSKHYTTLAYSLVKATKRV